VPAASSEEQAHALEALRQAEHVQPAPVAVAPAAPAPVAPAAAAPSSSGDQAQALQALRQAEVPAAGKAPESAGAAARRKKEQEAVALRIEKLQKEMNHPAAGTLTAAPAPSAAPSPAVAPAATGKEQRLADLLRRYQADEITPLQYHTERAKIVAEP
jgi:hypothetical protein